MLKISPVAEKKWVLYQRDDCHLCEQALAVLAQAHAPAFSSVFIDQYPVLEARYGHRVPVLSHTDTGCELDWPFDAQTLSHWFTTKT